MNGRNRVHILHTNDLHSHFEAMPHVHTVLKKMAGELEAAGEAVIPVDLGDHMDRVSVETEGTGGMANRAVMEAAGYKMVTLGNNELLTFSKEELHHLYHDAPFEVLATNVTDSDGERPAWIRSRSIRKVGGCRIGFLGVTIPFQNFYRLLGWDVSDPLEVLILEVPRLKKEVDAVVVLSHLGLGNDRRLAEEIPGIDVIMGSHTHHLLEVPERVGDTLIAAAGKFGSHVGHITLEWDSRLKRVARIEARCLETDRAEPDPKVKERIREYRREAEHRLSEPFAKLDRPLPVDWYGESPLGNFLADGLFHWVPDSECALVNSGQLLEGLEAGPVTRGLLHRICPHPINPARIGLEGRQIRKLLEEALDFNHQDREIRGFGFRGKKLGILNLAGIEAEYDPEAPPGRRLGEVRVGSERLQPSRTYRVATIDMFTFGVGYKEFKNGKDLKYYLPEFLRDILALRLRQPGAVKESFRARWHPRGSG
ncbi:2',3'-cyclic-nucleotide 2'-phosphodiesterase (5'-nucleotidase family) [Melghirimyces profundicolus]|uniref:2',3'-cyclic-nucleotide 2'-phosphodiesterase (5'-nucleotidase family) n=1 Tax=Melghirimyces profundicolus TaxID=1242148 RepID=A0A2T6C7M2_9BACL|nr:bifunctional UDP-sugar hydrolase/5'-nucleotidase [Melghirimyces profundicolus]PTX64317.1 2',3'-cyclic-nucleotide 2'-phosphodiesterase (5'-nucleotidase family) [Melghirimyces profundicolus]